MSEKKATATAGGVDTELLLGLVDLLHCDIRDCRHIQLADGIRALAAENERLRVEIIRKDSMITLLTRACERNDMERDRAEDV